MSKKSSWLNRNISQMNKVDKSYRDHSVKSKLENKNNMF